MRHRTAARIGILALLFVLLLVYVHSLSFSPVPSITNTSTDQNLVCTWGASADTTEQNVTWFNGSSPYGTTKTIPVGTNTSVISPYTHAKGEIWNCTVTLYNATDTTNLSARITIQNAVPQPLVVYNSSNDDIGNITTIYEDTNYSFNVTSTDPDGDSITYDILSTTQPTGSDINGVTGIFTWMPDYDQNGSNNVTFQATDDDPSEPATRNKIINFIVVLVNDPPYFSPNLTNQTVNENNGTWSYVVYGADEEGDTPFNFTLDSAGGLDLTLTTLNATTAELNFTSGAPNSSDIGNWSVTLNISDTYNDTTTESFNLEVRGENHAPMLANISNRTGIQGGNLTFYLNATDIDEADTITFSINDSAYNVTTIETNGSNATGLLDVSLLNNTHVTNRWVNISVTDGVETDSQVVFINITNTNDAPYINNMSYYGVNTQSNIDLRNMTAFSGITFKYWVNGTDPDLHTYEGEILNYTTNDSSFPLDNNTGIFNLTPGFSLIGNWSIMVTIEDDEGLTNTAVANLTVINNTAPYFNQTILDFTCFEDSPCELWVNATDEDQGDIVEFLDNTTLFAIDNETGLVNFTPNQTQLGSYSINITINDTRGVSNSTVFTLTLNNTNDAPYFDPDPDATFPIFVVNKTVTYDMNATDEDLDLNGSLAYDNITFYVYNLTSPYLFDINETTGLIIYMPNSSVEGNHSINITVNDTQGAQDSSIVNITIYPPSNPPVIQNVTPYGRPVSNDTVFAFYDTTAFPDDRTHINLSENYSIIFNHTTTNEAGETLSYEWYYDGSIFTSGLLENNHTLNYSFGFFSAGQHNLTLVVRDNRYESANFTWNLSINQTNRAPLFLNPLINLTMDAETIYSDYFVYGNGTTKFIDPDDDNNSNNIIDSNETNTLIFSVTPGCSVASFSITGGNLEVTPENVGTCTVRFNATDGIEVIDSNFVIVNVTDVPEETEQVVQQSGGGGSSTTRITVPIPEEVEIPKPVEIIASDVIVIYKNKTIIVPFQIKNTWNDTIQGINISAESNVSNMSMRFEQTFYSVMEPDEVQENSITVTDYREGATFEIKIIANVSEPGFSDSASVFINSLEQFSEGEDINSKIAFARDLLSNNPECQELNELLVKAQDSLSVGQALEASRLIEGVIQGCKYLIDQTTKVEEEQPKRFDSYFLFGNQYITYGAIGAIALLVFLSVMSFVTGFVKRKKKAKESEKPPT